MSELTDFLLARIAEDEAMARAGAAEGWAPGAGGLYWADGGPGGDISIEPSRLLAECAAKRQIVEQSVRLGAFGCDSQHGIEGDLILRTLAAIYADHPDYRAEWAL